MREDARAPVAVAAAIVLLALNLRTVFAGLPPVLDDVRSELGLSATASGLLTTGPVLCFGLLAPLAPRLARRYPPEYVLAVAGALTAAGAAVRGVGDLVGLYAGTLLAGAAVAVAQTTMPILIRGHHAERTGSLTGALSISIALSAAFSSALVVPLEHAFGDWRPALAVWGIPALVAAGPWFVRGRRADPVGRRERPRRLALGPAWSLPAFFGAQSATFFAALSWLPSILHSSGTSTGRAGLLLAISSVAQGAPAFLVPVLAARMESQRSILLAIVALSTAGVVGLLAAPHVALLWVILLGFGQGGALGLALILPLLRGGDVDAAAGLTALALSGGYLISSLGPWILGVGRDLSGGWTVPLLLLLALTLAELPTGLPAVRPGVLIAAPKP